VMNLKSKFVELFLFMLGQFFLFFFFSLTNKCSKYLIIYIIITSFYLFI
jgi:hypothetical protein